MVGGGEVGREGDWECNGCKNRNYAFRSFCNRCKQPRLLVDNKTPPNSKWLPRLGDWICSGCTNNNYASREKCKKCGQPKELAAMPAIAMPAPSVPTHPHYFARPPGVQEQRLSPGYFANGNAQQSLPLTSCWPMGADPYVVQASNQFGVQLSSTWSLAGNHGVSYMNQSTQLVAQKGWRNGDWVCNCGFHNYSSRLQCKKCNAAVPQALGTKRLASDELVQESDNKRLNAGHQAYPPLEQNANSGIIQPPSIIQPPGVIQPPSVIQPHGVIQPPSVIQPHGVIQPPGVIQSPGAYPSYQGVSTATPSMQQVNLQLPQFITAPAVLGKGARQWRDGDWICTNCHNHNYASRAECNRCKTPRETIAEPASVAPVSVA